ncbi:ABC transporter ATP-binding protein [Nonomuraea sp. NPDC050404]|uniref:ABC transporter ATP-binding protein n=1 Tax=Nonomuraea sp. NPDC050404 TaxID=3155783 RepID=UPI0033E789AA
MTAEMLLSVEDLRVTFSGKGRPDAVAVDGVSFTVGAGESVALVGESGCGKSVTSLAVMGLLPPRGARAEGRVLFEGRDLLRMPESERRSVRGNQLAMVFQDPMTALNPLVPVGVQIAEVLERHRGLRARAARVEAAGLLTEVGIPDAARRAKAYPHQLSGGMRQRVLIAIALACRPRLLIADEPTTALDVTVQAQILELLRERVRDSGTALVMISHDLGVVAGLCDAVHVMYAGRIVESGPCRAVFHDPRHHYTAGLLASIPRLDSDRSQPLRPIPGTAANLLPWDTGCAFAPRCTHKVDTCLSGPPPAEPTTDDHLFRCVNPVSSGGRP